MQFHVHKPNPVTVSTKLKTTRRYASHCIFCAAGWLPGRFHTTQFSHSHSGLQNVTVLASEPAAMVSHLAVTTDGRKMRNYTPSSFANSVMTPQPSWAASSQTMQHSRLVTAITYHVTTVCQPRPTNKRLSATSTAAQHRRQHHY